MKHLEKIAKKKLGEVLIAEGLITKEQLEIALAEQQKRGEKLGEVLTSMDFASEIDIAKTVAKRFQLPIIDPSKYSITEDVKKILPANFLRENRIVPLDTFGNILAIATYVIPKTHVIEEIKRETGFDIFIYISVQSDIKHVLRELVPEEEETAANESQAEWESIFDSGNEEVIKELKK